MPPSFEVLAKKGADIRPYVTTEDPFDPVSVDLSCGNG
jgi:hypothetical protein